MRNHAQQRKKSVPETTTIEPNKEERIPTILLPPLFVKAKTAHSQLAHSKALLVILLPAK